jgi:predicted metal-dependent hydrolase
MNNEHSIESSAHPDEDFRYDIVRSRHRRRTIAITIERDGRVVVRAPAKAARDTLHQFVLEKRPWIKKKLIQIRQERADAHPKAFVSGETFFYLGDSYPLKVTHSPNGAPPLVFIRGEFQLNERFKGDRKALFATWYKKQAATLIRQRIDRYREVMDIPSVQSRIISAKYQWGGCSSRDRITFSWRIVLAPLSMVDYVVVHELAHLRVRNHSSNFWKSVEAILPDYRVRRQWLREHGCLLDM